MPEKHIGKVVQVMGPVLDIRFADGELPELLNAIELQNNGKPLIVEVAQHIGDNVVRCIAMAATDGLVRGAEAVDTGGPIKVPVGDACLGRVFNLLGEPVDEQPAPTGVEHWPIHRPAPAFDEQESSTELLETGIKVVDLICPYAKGEDCEGVDMICLPEVPFNVDRFVEKVERMQKEKPSIVIAVSEGVKLADGRYVCELADDVHAVDAFGHKALTGTARFLANTVARRLDTKTRCIELSTLQRCAGHLTSRTDITEAYQVGGAAAKAAFEGHTGEMVALDRISNAPYQCTTSLHPISEVANLEKKVPLEWVNADHTAMLPEFLAYAMPLIQAELTPIYVEGLPHHIYLPET